MEGNEVNKEPNGSEKFKEALKRINDEINSIIEAHRQYKEEHKC